MVLFFSWSLKIVQLYIKFRFMVFNATFNNISVILWQSDLLVEYSEKSTNLPQVTNKLYHIMPHIVFTDEVNDNPIIIPPHIVFTDGRQQRQPNHNTTT